MSLKKSATLAFQLIWPVLSQSMDIAGFDRMQANHQQYLVVLILAGYLVHAIYKLSKTPMTPQPLGLPK